MLLCSVKCIFYIVTFQVKLCDGRTFTGVVEDMDLRSDLATIRIPCVSYELS